jgi:hypothetical protein
MDLDDLYRQLNRTRALEELDEVRMRKHAAVSKTQLRGDIDRLKTSLAHAGPIERQRLQESIHNMENDMRKFDGLPPLVRKTKPTTQELMARIKPKVPVITWAQAKSLAAPKVAPKSPTSPSPLVSSKGSRVRIRRSEKEQRRQERERLRQERERRQEQTPAQRALAKREKVLQGLDDAMRRESSGLNRLKPLSSQSSLTPFAKTQSKSSSSKK